MIVAGTDTTGAPRFEEEGHEDGQHSETARPTATVARGRYCPLGTRDEILFLPKPNVSTAYVSGTAVWYSSGMPPASIL